MKKIIIMFMLAIGIHGLTKADDADLYALVYPSSTGSLSDLYNADPITQDEVDKFLNNQPSKLDQYNKSASGAIGLGTRKLYLFRDTCGTIPAMQKTTGDYGYIYFDATAGYAKIRYMGTYTDDAIDFRPEGPSDTRYKKVLIDSATATTQKYITMQNMVYCQYDTVIADFGSACVSTNGFTCLEIKDVPNSILYIKIKTSSSDADQGADCSFQNTTLTLIDETTQKSTDIIGYKMYSGINDYFLPVYKEPYTTTAP